MTQISLYPFDRLPRFAADALAIRGRLLSVYQFLSGQTDFFSACSQPFVELMGEGVTLSLDHLDSGPFEKLAAALPQRALAGVVRLEPRALRAFLVMDISLLHLVSAHVLSGGKASPEQLSAAELKPITPLEEAVVEYVLVSLLERISETLGRKNFDMHFETVATDMAALATVASSVPSFAVFAIRVRCGARDFFMKVFLPDAILHDFGLSHYDNVYALQRLPTFEGMGVDLTLVAGSVTLSYEDIAGLTPGDIILLDETAVTKDADEWRGRARVLVGEGDGPGGWWVRLEPQDGRLLTRVDIAL